MLAQEIRGALRLAAVAHVVVAQLEKCVLLGRGEGPCGETSRSRGGYELTAMHHAIHIADLVGQAVSPATASLAL